MARVPRGDRGLLRPHARHRRRAARRGARRPGDREAHHPRPHAHHLPRPRPLGRSRRHGGARRRRAPGRGDARRWRPPGCGASESGSLPGMRRSVCAARDLPAGHVLAADDLTWLRPGGGVAPGDEGALLGRGAAARGWPRARPSAPPIWRPELVCGIAGYIGTAPPGEAQVAAALAALGTPRAGPRGVRAGGHSRRRVVRPLPHAAVDHRPRPAGRTSPSTTGRVCSR